MHVPYRTYPAPEGGVFFYPVLRVRLSRPHGRPSRTIEALVDSGAADCIFPAEVARAIGIADITTGQKESRLGIGGIEPVWFHPLTLYIGAHALSIRGGFSDRLPLAGLLGMRGFFDHFKVTFDPTSTPPGLQLERVHKT